MKRRKDKEIEQLVERFFRADTTLAEEHELYEYFQRKDIPQEMTALREMFCGFAVAQPSPTNASGVLPTAQKPSPTNQPAQPKILSRWHYAAAAAVALLVITGGSWAYHLHEQRLTRLTYEGSYMIVDGQRIDDISLIQPQIEEALLAARRYEESLSDN